MIENISSWAEQVIISVIIGTIIEMILPRGNSKKYIKTVIGIYILYSIVSPAVSLFADGFEVDLSEYAEYFEINEIDTIEVYSIEDTYKNELIKQIKADVNNLGYIASNISLELNLDTGEIEKIAFKVTKFEESDENNVNINIEINNININEKNNNDNLLDTNVEEIKELLIDDYGVESENITIY